MTNPSAMTALQTLRQTNKMLDMTQNRISTGYRVAEAADNSAYWSIATTMRADNKALSTVQDALGLGSATVDVAYTAMDKVNDLVIDIKSKLVAAKQPGIDKSKIQSDIAQMQQQLKGISESANFYGANWLSVDSSSPDYEQTRSVVSSFTRDSGGNLSIGTIEIDTAKTNLFDANAAKAGLLEKGIPLDSAVAANVANGSDAGADGPPAEAGKVALGTFAASTLVDDDQITFDIAVDGGDAVSVKIDKNTIDAALGTDDGVIGSAADMATVVNEALSRAEVTGVSAADNAGSVELTSATTGATSSVAITNAGSSTNPNTIGILDIDITNASGDELDTLINGVDTMSETVTQIAADLGAVKNRVSLQQDFVKTLMDAIDRGVGQLVDADMSEESTKLKALQVQQQLGIQALSIANQNAQSIMALFQN